VIGKREDIKIDARSYKKKIRNEKNTFNIYILTK